MKARTWFRRFLGVGALALGMVFACGAFAQEGGPGGGRGGRGGPGGGRGGFNREDFERRMAERMKEMLGVQDEEWQVIQPLLQNVQEKQRAMRMGGFFGRGRGGPGGGDNEEPADIAALRAALDNPNTPAADIKAKLDAYRAGQKQREEELAAARDELRKVLTVRQEAQLVLMGMLD